MASKKQSLGQGVDALFKSKSMETFHANINERGELVAEIDLSLIRPNREQPRKHFDEEKIRALADSIEQYGLLQPIVLRKSGSSFALIAGERRLRAVQLLGKTKIRAIIHDADESIIAQLALMENLQREDLTPIEEAMAYDFLIGEHHLTQEQVARIAGKSRSQVANMLRLLSLEPVVRDAVDDGSISTGQAKLLLSVKNKSDRLKLFGRIRSEGLTVRQIEQILAGGTGPQPKKEAVKQRRPVHQDVELQNVIDRLIDKLGTKVQINDRNGRGSIVIDYYSNEELERLVDLLFHVEQ